MRYEMMIKNQQKLPVKPKICCQFSHTSFFFKKQDLGQFWHPPVLRRRSDDDMKEEIEVEDMYNKYA